MEHFLGPEVYEKMIANKTIEIFPLETMRGETFDETFMILTEFQNATYEQIMMFATRIGQHSKCIIEGDLDQIDAPKSGGHRFWNEQYRSHEMGQGIGFSVLNENDIVRSGIVRTIIDNARIARKIKEN
jgi:phosphate starvation-inducible PhoH-like protein